MLKLEAKGHVEGHVASQWQSKSASTTMVTSGLSPIYLVRLYAGT